ncbi:MAG: anti-sigma factor family protein, partial [Chloroflexota bacterium]
MRFGHPSGLTLSRFVDGDLSASRLERIAAHVERCGACRERVDFIRTLGTTAAKLDFGHPPDVADEVLRRRRTGERIDLLADEQAANATPAVPWTARFGIAASIALAALGGGYMLLAPTAGAHRSELSFDPGTPTSGEMVSLTYEPASYLAHHDSLRLRMRARNAESPNPRGGVIGELRVATLRKNADGTFEGRFALEPGDLYVAAAVEDFAGENIDTNFGQLWDVLVAEQDGEPSVAALESKYRVLEPFNWVMAAEWAAEAAERYPGNPFGWTMLYVHQSRIGTVSLPDSLQRFHEGKLRELMELSSEYSADELYWLADYARRLRQTTLHEQVLDRLRDLAPQHRAILEQRLAEIVGETGDELPTRLDRLDDVWQRTNAESEVLIRQGILAAARSGNSAAVDVWIDRARRLPDLTESSVVALLAPFGGLVSQRIRLRSEWLEKLADADDSSRSLRTSMNEHRQILSDSIESTKMKLASDLVIAGDTARALSVMADVAEQAWKPEVLEPYANELLAIGDTTAARPIVGMLYADPVVGEQARAKYGSILSSDAPEIALAEAEYVDRVRESTTDGRRLPRDMNLQRIGRGALSTSDLRGMPTVVLMWDPRLIDAASLLADFQARTRESRSAGINSLIVTRSELNQQLSKERKIVYDRGYELSQMLGEFEVPKYVVLDSKLTVVARVSDP